MERKSRYRGRNFIRTRGRGLGRPPGGGVFRPEHRAIFGDDLGPGPGRNYFAPGCAHKCDKCWALEMNEGYMMAACTGCGHSGGDAGEHGLPHYIDYECDRCTASCPRCLPAALIDGEWLCKMCQAELGKRKTALVVQLHIEESMVSCRLLSGREVLRQALEEGEGQLVQIRGALTELLPHFLPGNLRGYAWDRRAYTQAAFAKYYGDAAPALWAEATRRSFQLHLVLPDGTTAPKKADASTKLSRPEAAAASSSPKEAKASTKPCCPEEAAASSKLSSPGAGSKEANASTKPSAASSKLSSPGAGSKEANASTKPSAASSTLSSPGVGSKESNASTKLSPKTSLIAPHASTKLSPRTSPTAPPASSTRQRAKVWRP